MPIFYALVARKTTVLAEYTARSGNFPTVTRTLLSKITDSEQKQSYLYERCFFSPPPPPSQAKFLRTPPPPFASSGHAHALAPPPTSPFRFFQLRVPLHCGKGRYVLVLGG
jgi:hypothetical protein